MKRILVAFACAAGMLLVLSSSCDDNDLTSAGGGSKSASGLSQLPSPYPCNSGGGTGSIDAYPRTSSCTTGTTYTPARGACFQVSGGYVVISFDRDEGTGGARELSIQFLIPEEGFAAKVYNINANEAIFRGKVTGKREDLWDSSLCPRTSCSTNQVEVTAISGTPGAWAAGDTIDLDWDAGEGDGVEASAVEDGGGCGPSWESLISDGTWSDIPYM
jgi:hypothetical protein